LFYQPIFKILFLGASTGCPGWDQGLVSPIRDRYEPEIRANNV